MNALHSLYGGAQALAKPTPLAGNIGGQDRDQEAWTPDDILAIAAQALGGRIALDPCGASAWALPEAAKNGKVKRKAIEGGWFADVTISSAEGQAGPHGGVVLRGDGLSVPWDRPTFVNPPYDPLEPWLRKCVAEASKGTPIVSLGPVRPHRRWWLPLVRTGEIVFLNYDVRFKGWTQAVPFPLCLVAWNCEIPQTPKETGRWSKL